jgi:hypothetical protein
MQQPHLGEVTIYADIAEVRMETRAADCKKLLADGWVLLGVYPRQRLGGIRHVPAGEAETAPGTRSGMCGAWWAMSWERDESSKRRHW